MGEIAVQLHLGFHVYGGVFQLFVQPKTFECQTLNLILFFFLHTIKSLSRRIPLLKQLVKRHAEQRRRDARVTSQLPCREHLSA